ncbi:GDSL-type esterase/lipase family protein [Streptococcus suis]|uniref:DUF459 domain-containing protein n=1 Tax=Streptococcus suis TaxID=1307 RepID=UPI001ABE2ED0|nr:esterase [Streptococcus suis]
MSDIMYPEVLTVGSGSIRIATVGDSLTYGYGLEDRLNHAYPCILAEKLGHAYQVANFGLSGRSLQSTADYPYFQEKNAQLSLDYQPDLVLIMIGSNDSRAPYWNQERFEQEYRQMIETYLNLESQPDVIIMVPPYIPTSRFGLNNEIVKTVLQEMIPRLAEEYGLEWINFYPLTEGHAEYYSDGLHLTPLGNQLLADEVYRKITS